MSNFALATFILMVFVFASGLGGGGRGRRDEQQKCIAKAPQEPSTGKPGDKA